MAVGKNVRGQSRPKATAPVSVVGGQHRGQSTAGVMGRSLEEMGIREVWSSNLYEEMYTLSFICDKYPVVAMDTEFPGIVARPIGDFRSSADYQYQLMRCNVHLLKIIQVGLSFFTEDGKRPPGIHTWQFNFNFNLNEDMYAQDSIQLLQKSGIDFDRLQREGISSFKFAEYLLTTGLVLNKKVLWLSFHSGYDFGYMVKMLDGRQLPEKESDFFEMFRMLFPVIYDVKHLMNATKNLRGGLQEIADILQVERIGPQHQAGSDSLLTGLTFFRMKELCFDGNIDQQRYSGYLYGLSATGQSSTDSVLINTSEEGRTRSAKVESAIPIEMDLSNSQMRTVESEEGDSEEKTDQDLVPCQPCSEEQRVVNDFGDGDQVENGDCISSDAYSPPAPVQPDVRSDFMS